MIITVATASLGLQSESPSVVVSVRRFTVFNLPEYRMVVAEVRSEWARAPPRAA